MPIAIFAMPTTPTFDVRTFGAVGDGATLCTAAIQTAIDKAAAVHGVVEIPAGRFLSGSIRLKSGVRLEIDRGGTLLGSARRRDYRKGVWYSLILGEKLHDVSITGNGTIDGQGAAVAADVLRMVKTGELKIPPKSWRPSEVDRPQIIEIKDCLHVAVRGITIKNSCCWVETYRNVDGLLIDGIKVDSKTYWNNDGIDVVDCKNATISNCDIDSDDDGVCLKSDDPKRRCENIVIEKCRIRCSASAVKFGTSSRGGFRNVTVRDISVRDTFRSALALESVDGGTLENVLAERIKAVHTGNAFFIRLGHRNRSAPPGRVRNIVLRDFDVQVPAGRPDFGYPFHGPQFSEPHNICPSSIVGHVQQPIENVLLEGIHIRMPGGGSRAIAHAPAHVPERPTEYPEFTNFGELPAWGLYIRHVRGITIRGLSMTRDAPDYRPAIVRDDVR